MCYITNSTNCIQSDNISKVEYGQKEHIRSQNHEMVKLLTRFVRKNEGGRSALVVK